MMTEKTALLIQQLGTVMIALSIVWVFLDAKQRGIGEKAFAKGKLGAITPPVWVGLFFCLWAWVFPVYLVARAKHPIIEGRRDWYAYGSGWGMAISALCILVLACAAVPV